MRHFSNRSKIIKVALSSLLFSIPAKYKGDLNLKIYNAKGEVVYDQLVKNSRTADQMVNMDLAELPKGLYVIHLVVENWYSVLKFVKVTN